MRFAADEWLWGVLFSLVLAGILAAQGMRLARARRKFAHDDRISELLTAKTGLRRTVQAILSTLAVALVFVAAAQPQYGKGTRILPATNLDVVVVLDYSKSMYARDVSPSRIGRAKVEVGKLIRKLGGARFAAVAFAGESIAFPLTSDGSAIAQFFQGLEPNDMPVGGTAIARALESGRQLLERDPLSKNHERVMILVTDGEDLEGDPVGVARDAHAEGIRVDVVQIGGQSPEPIPEIDEHGVAKGLRKDSSGSLLTTQLTPEGEAQLSAIASEGGGQLVRAAQGDTGIGTMTEELRKMMTEELSEKVETVFADIYYYPLALAVLLLFIETFVGTARKRIFSPDPPKGSVTKRTPRRMRTTAALLALCCLGCERFDSLFERESPVVNEAIELLNTDNPEKASQLLIEYLETGPCEEGVIGAGDRARKLRDASFDLALSFSDLSSDSPAAPAAGAPSAPTQPAPGAPQNPGASPPVGGLPSDAEPPAPSPAVDCALRILGVISGDPNSSAALRARAFYVAGNLEMRRENFEDAVVSYDAGLLYAPGVTKEQLEKGPLAGTTADLIGISIAHNRALALRLREEKEKQEQEQENQSNQDDQQDQEQSEDEQESEQNEQEQSEDDSQDESSDQEQPEDEQESEQDQESEQEQPNEDSQEQESEDQKGPDEGEDQEQPNQEQQPQEPSEGKQAQNPSEARDQRMLDLLEQAPTLQQHRAEERKNQGVRVRSTMEDK